MRPILPATALLALGAAGARPAAPTGDLGPGACRLDPETVPLRPTQSAPESRGSMILVQAASPFGIAVDAEGHQRYDITLEVDRLRRRPGAAYVAWAATPELDRWTRLGTLPESNRLSGRVAWNKFLVFVSEEADPEVERWSGPIVLTGLSPSGRMHTMAGHGPFEDVNCQNYW